MNARHRQAIHELVGLHGDDPKKLALIDYQEKISFILENEWGWFSGMPSLADW